jgi:hypothetical protein
VIASSKWLTLMNVDVEQPATVFGNAQATISATESPAGQKTLIDLVLDCET